MMTRPRFIVDLAAHANLASLSPMRHMIELILPLLAVIGIILDYLANNYDEIAENRPVEPFSTTGYLPMGLVATLLIVSLIFAVQAARTNGWFSLVSLALFVLAGVSFVALQSGKVSFPSISKPIAGVLKARKDKIQPTAKKLGLPLAVVACLIEFTFMVF